MLEIARHSTATCYEALEVDYRTAANQQQGEVSDRLATCKPPVKKTIVEPICGFLEIAGVSLNNYCGGFLKLLLVRF